MEQLLVSMFCEPTAHHLCDSGGIYGRAYQTNAKRDLAKEPQATLAMTKWGLEFSVNTYKHLEACLERDIVCEAFDAIDDGSVWNGEQYGVTADQSAFLERIGAEVDEGWNSYNWENSFDQVLQGHRVEINGEEYTLLQVHGGCDVRSGYTGARLFKLQDWMNDYWLNDECSFDLPRDVAEKAGYPVTEVVEYGHDSDWLSIDVRNWSGAAEIYDPRLSDNVEVPEKFWENLPEMKLEGVQRACEH